MFKTLRRFIGRQYFPLNTIEISAPAIRHNYHYLSNLVPGLSVAPVLKSNAYGHGLPEMAKILDSEKPPFFCVDSLFEAYELYRSGIKTPILIMGYVQPESLKVKRLPFNYSVFTREMLAGISKYQPQAGIHVFVDTGMHREGVPLAELPDFIDEALTLGLSIEGLMSHLGAADKPTFTATCKQDEIFDQANKILESKQIRPKYQHLFATSGLLHAHEFSHPGNLARVGLGIYGYDPEGLNTKLQPALRFTSTLAQVKDIPRGATVGYDFTFAASRALKLGVLPVGYNDGVDRRLSNVGWIRLEGVECPIVGRVSMNITLIDVSRVLKPSPGMKVELISMEKKKPNSLASLAGQCKTIPYELLIHLHPSVHRMVV